YSGLLAIIIVAFGITLFAVTHWVLSNSVDSTLSATADEILSHSRVYLIPEFGKPSRIVISLFSDLDFFRASGVGVQVWRLGDGDPKLLSGSSNLNGYSSPFDLDALSQEQRDDDTADINRGYSTVNIGTSQLRVLTLPYDIQGQRGALQAATSLDTINQSSQGLLLIIVIATGVALIGSVILGWMLANSVLKPIDDITRSAAQITAAADLKTRLTWNGPMDELGRLVEVLNKAMERLEHLFTVQQRFVADVSHELRTPLTAISGNVEVIKRYGMDQESIDAIESEAHRMSRLVNDLLLLARADNGELKLNLEELDLDIVVGEAYREARILAKDRDLKVTVVDFEPVRIKGDGDRLKQLLSNLLINAIKFTPDGGQIIINLRKTEHDAILQVQDTGIGISPEDLQRIFDRFYQADASRVRLDNAEGAGLGLSIAQWIAQAHGGKIQVDSTVGEGTTFTVTIPHIEEPERVLSEAVTRPRLSIIRRTNPPEKEKEADKVKP
ncbi:MAG: HAMP domain-containing sensor histidine kinase, partial [Chloroflexota bacterium]